MWTQFTYRYSGWLSWTNGSCLQAERNATCRGVLGTRVHSNRDLFAVGVNESSSLCWRMLEEFDWVKNIMHKQYVYLIVTIFTYYLFTLHVGTFWHNRTDDTTLLYLKDMHVNLRTSTIASYIIVSGRDLVAAMLTFYLVVSSGEVSTLYTSWW